jgi:hypothetical protein
MFSGVVDITDRGIMSSHWYTVLDEPAGPGEVSVTATSESTIDLSGEADKGDASVFVKRERGQASRGGYDLRASRDRCPECGEPIPTAIASRGHHEPT